MTHLCENASIHVPLMTRSLMLTSFNGLRLCDICQIHYDAYFEAFYLSYLISTTKANSRHHKQYYVTATIVLTVVVLQWAESLRM